MMVENSMCFSADSNHSNTIQYICIYMIFSYECLKDNHTYMLAPLKTDTFHPVDLARFEGEAVVAERLILVEDVL